MRTEEYPVPLTAQKEEKSHPQTNSHKHQHNQNLTRERRAQVQKVQNLHLHTPPTSQEYTHTHTHTATQDWTRLQVGGCCNAYIDSNFGRNQPGPPPGRNESFSTRTWSEDLMPNLEKDLAADKTVERPIDVPRNETGGIIRLLTARTKDLC